MGAFATIAPAGSEMAPVMVPRSPWPNTVQESKSKLLVTQRERTKSPSLLTNRPRRPMPPVLMGKSMTERIGCQAYFAVGTYSRNKHRYQRLIMIYCPHFNGFIGP